MLVEVLSSTRCFGPVFRTAGTKSLVLSCSAKKRATCSICLGRLSSASPHYILFLPWHASKGGQTSASKRVSPSNCVCVVVAFGLHPESRPFSVLDEGQGPCFVRIACWFDRQGMRTGMTLYYKPSVTVSCKGIPRCIPKTRKAIPPA